mmetsp:Transcript_54013/g.135782  ORF Transcript_54013/g.135782 Transcript_54013/m.135782 type:complete len:92 (+) Transcript_54013:344-619(+)
MALVREGASSQDHPQRQQTGEIPPLSSSRSRADLSFLRPASGFFFVALAVDERYTKAVRLVRWVLSHWVDGWMHGCFFASQAYAPTHQKHT